MQCRHCGKELPLLKRLRGGGEFCSDAHRQSFQEEYNQLALSRLLSGMPSDAAPAAPTAPPEQPPSAKPAAPPSRIALSKSPLSQTASKPAQPALPQEAAHRSGPAPVSRTPAALVEPPAPQPVTRAAEARAGARSADSAPAELAGFLAGVPDPMMTRTPYVATLELGRMAVDSPSLPSRGPVDISTGTRRIDARQVAYSPRVDAKDYHTPMSEHPAEAREFGRLAPVLEIRNTTDRESVPDASLEPMEIQLASFPPAAGTPWLSPAREFPAVIVELDGLARLDFSPIGAPPRGTAPSAQASEPQSTASQATETQAEESVSSPELAKPVRLENTAVEPVRIDEAFLESFGQLAPRGAVIHPSAPEPAEAPVAEPPVPDMVTQPLPVTLHGTAAGRGKVTEMFPSPLSLEMGVQLPPSTALPLRPSMVFGPAPAVPARRPELKPAPKPELKPEPKPEPKLELKPAPRTELKKDFQKRPDKAVRPINGKTKKVDAPAPAEELPPPPAPEAPAPLVAAVAPAAPIARISPVVDLPAPAMRTDLPMASGSPTSFDLGLPSLNVQAGPWARLSAPVKIGAAVAILAVISGIGYLVLGGGHSNAPQAKAAQKEAIVVPGLAIPDAGWIADWSPDSSGRARRISLLRGSVPLSDYRVEFQAQIEAKALGWVFRGMDPKNFYVTKLEVIKPGLEPTVALVRFAVINGREQDRAQVPLPLPVRVDTTYKVRFEAVGTRFTTWVQDQKIDEWNDSRIASGGVGLYSERGESAPLQGIFKVVQLIAKN